MLTALHVTDTLTGRQQARKAVRDWQQVPADPLVWQEQVRARWGLDDPVFVAQEQTMTALDLGDIDEELRRMTGGA